MTAVLIWFLIVVVIVGIGVSALAYCDNNIPKTKKDKPEKDIQTKTLESINIIKWIMIIQFTCSVIGGIILLCQLIAIR
jgi:uncharacterized membrane protein YidH (DUF202 family)